MMDQERRNILSGSGGVAIAGATTATTPVAFARNAHPISVSEWDYHTIRGLTEALQARQISASELFEHTIARRPDPRKGIMASGHVNRTNRPNTWLHRPACKREERPCQLGDVHTWHEADMWSQVRNVRFRGKADRATC